MEHMRDYNLILMKKAQLQRENIDHYNEGLNDARGKDEFKKWAGLIMEAMNDVDKYLEVLHVELNRVMDHDYSYSITLNEIERYQGVRSELLPMYELCKSTVELHDILQEITGCHLNEEGIIEW